MIRQNVALFCHYIPRFKPGDYLVVLLVVIFEVTLYLNLTYGYPFLMFSRAYLRDSKHYIQLVDKVY